MLILVHLRILYAVLGIPKTSVKCHEIWHCRLLLFCDLKCTDMVCVHLRNLCNLYYCISIFMYCHCIFYKYMHMPICNNMHIGSSVQTSSLLTHIVCICNLFTQLCVFISHTLVKSILLILSTCSICYRHLNMHIDTIICSILSYELWYCFFFASLSLCICDV